MSDMITQNDEDYEENFHKLTKRNQKLVDDGEVNMFEGRGGPVLRWSASNTLSKKPGALVPGTSLELNRNHGNVGVTGRKGDYKRTNAYKELLQYIVPASLDSEVYGSLSWLLNRGFEQIEGGDVSVPATCPDCGHNFKVKAYKKGDSKALQIILEQVLDQPAKRQDINVQGSVMHEYLNEPIDSDVIEVYTLTPEQARERDIARLKAAEDNG